MTQTRHTDSKCGICDRPSHRRRTKKNRLAEIDELVAEWSCGALRYGQCPNVLAHLHAARYVVDMVLDWRDDF